MCAKSIVLTNEDGQSVTLTVGSNGKIDIKEELWDVFVFPNRCLVREYNYLGDDIPSNFSGLTPYQILLNFSPFVGWKRSTFMGQVCQALCTPKDSQKLIDKTLLFNFPPNKIAKRVVVLDSKGNEIKEYALPYENDIRQLTINMPSFKDTETEDVCHVHLPQPIAVSHPLPPGQCVNPPPMGVGEVDVEDEQMEDFIDPEKEYEVVYEEYEGNTYYNITLNEGFFMDESKTQYLAVELVDRTEVPEVDPF